MPRAPRVCSQPGCGHLVPTGYCPAHNPRGTTTQRGYGTAHQQQRRQHTQHIAAGHVTCWRCGTRITPDTDWHLGHDDADRTITRGPEHARCNLRAAGKAAHDHGR